MDKERLRRHTIEKKFGESRDSKRLFGVSSYTAFLEHIGAFGEIIDTHDVDGMVEKLNDLQQLELMVLRKGHNGEYLSHIDNSLRAVADELGIADLGSADISDIDNIIREGKVDPMVLAQWANVQYHFRNDSLVEHVGGALAGSQELPAIVRANAINVRGSLSDRLGDIDGAREWNRKAMTLLGDEPDSPNIDWQRLKIEHGLIVQRSRGKIFPDMIDQLSRIAQQRMELGDAMHVPRTYLDMGDIAYRQGDLEQALVYLKQALEGLGELGYDNASFHTTDKLAQVRKDMGEDRRAKNIWVHGIGIGERMKKILEIELDEMKEKRDRALKRPATCLVGLGNDNFLVEQVELDGEQRFMCITVDQERSAKAEVKIREKIENIIHHVLDGDQDLKLSKRNTGIFLRNKGKLEDGRKFAMFTLDLGNIPGINAIVDTGIDKTPKDGYSILSWSQLLAQRELFDTHSRELIELENSRREES